MDSELGTCETTKNYELQAKKEYVSWFILWNRTSNWLVVEGDR